MDLSFFSLEGKVAMVTGGNSGLGQAIALGFCGVGARVAVTGRNAAKNEQMAEELGERGAVYVMDVRREEEIERTIRQVVNEFGRLDILVNNAGINHTQSLVDVPSEAWEEIIDTNLNGAFLCARHAARAMIARGEGGKIINIGSVTANFGSPDFAAYTVSKSGLVGLTSALAVELAPHNIQANLIEPGYFETEISSGVPGWLKEQLILKTPAARWGKPHELVGAAVFLASPAASYVTGACIRVDGGYTIAERQRYPL